MKIAFISYEYPIETGGGGIGTYLSQMVKYLPQYGHQVVVFCGTLKHQAFGENDFIYRVPCEAVEDFNTNLITYFEAVHL